VLIHGETGTGKELVARRIHATGTRKDGPFVAINCAAIPSALLESELFGHARGAFTDAKADRAGLFVQAHHGTLFLDEIGEMPLEMQAKLLRALQERKVRPVGSNVEVAFDARLVTATNRDLEEEIEQKRFREDLFYRINVVRIGVPPLSERSSDVLELAQYFLGRHAERTGTPSLGVSTEAAKKLIAYATGPATSASWRTASSARSPSRATTRSPSTTCPTRSRSYRTRTFRRGGRRHERDRHRSTKSSDGT
jgi:two-component system, NtrC family, response regulator HydG